MLEIGIFDLKTHLSETISRVQDGEEFLITNRGKAVALLTLPEDLKNQKKGEFFSDWYNLMSKAPLVNNVDDLMSMIEEGRR